MKKGKAPKPDGYAVDFFFPIWDIVWDIVGENFYNAVFFFVNSLNLHRGIIVLVFP